MSDAEMFHGLGIGDFIQAESYWSESERDRLKTMYWATRGYQGLIDLMQASPTYRNVKHVVLLDNNDNPLEIQKIQDKYHEISTQRHLGLLSYRVFTGSTFLRERLIPDMEPFPKPYAVVHATTPYNSPQVQAWRSITPPEWQAITSTLRNWNLTGIVLNSQPEAMLPDDDYLVDFSGQTTLPEAVEIIKHADGFIGIDSWMAICAAQVIEDPSRLIIRTRNPHVEENRFDFYHPHIAMPFLVPTIGGEPYPERAEHIRLPERTFVQLTRPVLIGQRCHWTHDIVAVAPDRAEDLVRIGHAIYIDYA